MIFKNNLAFESIGVNAPKSALHIGKEPETITSHNVNDVGGVIVLILDLDFFKALNCDFRVLVCLRSINSLERPPFDVTISCCRNNLVVFEHTHLDVTVMQRSLFQLFKH